MTDNHREDYAKEAMQDGRHAARSGSEANPHFPGSLEYAAWQQGWGGVQKQESEMKDLIAEMEAATEGSREFDITIARLLGHKLRVGPWMAAPNPMEPDYPATIPVPFYTTSLDAALILVPKGWTWSVDATAPECLIDWVLYEPGLWADGARAVKGESHTPALALCIASLRARQALLLLRKEKS